MANISASQKQFIVDAVAYLEFPRFLVKLSHLIGRPVELGLERLPAPARNAVQAASQRAIESALQTALSTLNKKSNPKSFEHSLKAAHRSGKFHGAGTAISGAVGGFFGLPALLVELPLTTTIMLRSISKIATDFGVDLNSREAQLDCLYVFALGGPLKSRTEAEALDTSYYGSRVVFADLVEKAVKYAASHSVQQLLRSVEQHSATGLTELVTRVASRFEVVVGRKTVGQLIPGIGAGAGALINVAFTEHFNEAARFHFGLKRLEAEFGTAPVREWYESTLKELIREKSKQS